MANQTKDYSYYLVDLGVAYTEDTDAVVDLARSVADGMRAEAPYRDSMLDPLEVLGVDAFAESQVTIKMRLKTLPLKQWESDAVPPAPQEAFEAGHWIVPSAPAHSRAT
jgi:small conductance mechanosensitive channel